MNGKVFLFISTVGHIPGILRIADLLNKSNLYVPIIIYYDRKLYNLNVERYRLYNYDGYIWNDTHFVKMLSSKALVGSQELHETKTQRRKDLEERYFSNKFHLLLAKAYGAALQVIAVCDYIIKCLACRRIRLLHYLLGSHSRDVQSDKKKLQEIFLSILEQKWHRRASPIGAGRGYRRLYELFDGMFFGLPEIKKLLEEFKALLKQESPCLIILPEENLLYNHHFLVKTAHKYKVPCCVVPYTIVNKNEWLVSFYKKKKYFADKGWNRLLSIAFSEWTIAYKGQLLILPRKHVLLAEFLGCRPKVPWLINSGSADVIAAEGRFMEEYYLNAGIEKERLCVTGALSDDQLYAALSDRNKSRFELEKEFSVEGAKRIILLALPPDQFESSTPNNTEFSGYSELISFMVNQVLTYKKNEDIVIISLHPRTRREDVCLDSNSQVMIIERPIESLIPIADMFIAVSSATIRLAVSCGLPVINYDAYRFSYQDYDDFPGIVQVDERRGYSESLSQMLNDESFYNSIAFSQKEAAKMQGVLDGKAGDRLLKLFNRLVGST